MALRVLLADESTTIKKVMQLALQDFAVEVKAVHVGVDVVAVARQFQPDIIFADVLLQKKNGYEVCGDLKQDPELKSIPVVLMWSSFMDLDEALAASCGADRRLEKPFDIENLRQLLLELVPKTHTQRLAHFLKFPASFSDPMRKEESAKQAAPATAPVSAPVSASGSASGSFPPSSASVSTSQPMQPGVASSMPQPPPTERPIQQPLQQATLPEPPQPQRQRPRLREQPGQASSTQSPQPQPQSQSQSQSQSPSAQERPAPHPVEHAPTWNMESFEDISSFETNLEAVEPLKPVQSAASTQAPSPNVPELEVPLENFGDANLDLEESSQNYGAHPDDDDDDDDEVFSELRLQEQAPENFGANQNQESSGFENMTLTREIPNLPPRAQATEESDDPWSHQDLSRFKVDLPPVTASNPEHGIDLEIPEASHGDYSSNQAQTLRGYEQAEAAEPADTQGYDAFSFGGHHPQSQRKTPLHPDEIAQAEEVEPNFELDANELELSTLPDQELEVGAAFNLGGNEGENLGEDDRTQQISYEPPRKSQRRPGSEDFSAFDAAKIPQLSPERLEQIIRAQAREIVEAVVRKIVPDLATDIIREELQRLLEDTASVDGRSESQSAYGTGRDSGSRGRIR